MPGGEGLPDSLTWRLWIAEYVVSAYIIVTTLVLAALRHQPETNACAGRGWPPGPGQRLVGVRCVYVSALMTLSCILGFRKDYRKAMANKVWGVLTIRVPRP